MRVITITIIIKEEPTTLNKGGTPRPTPYLFQLTLSMRSSSPLWSSGRPPSRSSLLCVVFGRLVFLFFFLADAVVGHARLLWSVAPHVKHPTERSAPCARHDTHDTRHARHERM